MSADQIADLIERLARLECQGSGEPRLQGQHVHAVGWESRVRTSCHAASPEQRAAKSHSP
jgi:hypothetical protein